jgi:hypothetical protein
MPIFPHLAWALGKYRLCDNRSHIETDSEREEEMVFSPPHRSAVQRGPVEPVETVEPVDLVDPIDPIHPIDVPREITVGQKRPAWARQTLQEAEEHATRHGTFRDCSHEPPH